MASLILEIQGFRDFEQALAKLDSTIEALDKRIVRAGSVLEVFNKGFTTNVDKIEQASKAIKALNEFFSGLSKLASDRHLQQLPTFMRNMEKSIDSFLDSVTAQKTKAIATAAARIRTLTESTADFEFVRKRFEGLRKEFRSGFSLPTQGFTDLAQAIKILIDIPFLKFILTFGRFKNALVGMAKGLAEVSGAFTEDFGSAFSGLARFIRSLKELSGLDIGKLSGPRGGGIIQALFGDKKASGIAGQFEQLAKVLDRTKGSFTDFATSLSQGDARIAFANLASFFRSLQQFSRLDIGKGSKGGLFGSTLGILGGRQATGLSSQFEKLAVALEKVGPRFATFGKSVSTFNASASKTNRNVRELAQSARLLEDATEFMTKRRDPVLSTDLFNIKKLGGNIKAESKRLGEDVVTGFRTAFDILKKNNFNPFKAFVDTAKKFLGISSPSRVFRQMGQDVVTGFAQGITSLANIGLKAATGFVTGFFNGLRGLNTRFRQFTTNLANEANQILQRSLNRVVAGGLVSFAQSQAIRAPIQAAVDFESAFAGVIKTVPLDDLGEEEAQRFLDGLRDGLRGLATDDQPLAGLENAQIQLTNIAETAGQLGVARDDILAFTETIGQLGLATDIVGQEGATQLAQFANILQSTQFDRIGATIVALGNNSATTESQILEFAQRLAGAGNAAGLSEPQILAIGASMASLGLNAEAGSSAFNQFLTSLTKATAVEQQTVTGAQRIAAANRTITELMNDRTLATRNLESAQDRLNRATTVSSRNTAITAVERATAQLGELDAQIQRTQSGVAGISETAVFNLTSGSKELEAFARVAGVSAAEFANAFKNEPVDAIELFVKGLGELDNEAQVAVLDELGLDGLRLADTLRRLAGNTDLLGEAIGLANGAWEENTALTNEAQQRYETTQSAINRLRNIFNELKITIGDLLLPDVRRLAEGFGTVLQRVTEFAKANPDLVRNLARVGIIIGGVVAGFITLTGIIGVLAGGILSGVAAGIGVLASSFGLISTLLLGPTGIVAGLTAAFAALQGFAPIRGIIDDLKTVVSENAIVGTIGEIGISNRTKKDMEEIKRLTEERKTILEQIAALEQGVVGSVEDQANVIVKQGDTLSEIALRNGTTVAELLKLNPEIENPNLIFPDQEIRLTPVIDSAETSEELASLQADLSLLDRALNAVINDKIISFDEDKTRRNLTNAQRIVEGVLSSEVGIRIFGEVDEVTKQQLLTAAADLETPLSNLKNLMAVEMPAAIQGLFSADPGAGAERLKTVIADVRSEIGTILEVFGRGLSGNTPLVALTGEGGGSNQTIGGFLVDSISTQLEGILWDPVQRSAEISFGNLLPVIGAAASIVFGPVAGLTIGIAGLIVKAIEVDFLGIGTAIRESGIAQSLQSGLDVIRDIIGGIFGSGSQTSLVALTGESRLEAPEQNPLITAFTGVFDQLATTIRNAASILGPEFADAFESIKTGVKGFIDAIGVRDAEDFGAIITDIGNVINTLIQGVTIVARVALASIGSLFERVLPQIGSAVDSFVDLIDAAARGDILAIGTAIADFATSIGNIGVGLLNTGIDTIESAFNTLTGLNVDFPEIPDIETLLGNLVVGVQGFIDTLPTAITNLQIEAEAAWIRFQAGFVLKILEFALSVVNEINRVGGDIQLGLQNLVAPINEGLVSLGLEPIVITPGDLIDTSQIEAGIRERSGPDITGISAFVEAQIRAIAGNVDQGGHLSEGGQQLADNTSASIDRAIATALQDAVPDEEQLPELLELKARVQDLIGGALSPDELTLAERFNTEFGPESAVYKDLVTAGNNLPAGIAQGITENQEPLTVAATSMKDALNTQTMGMATNTELSVNRTVTALERIPTAIAAVRNSIQQARDEGLPVPTAFASGGVGRGYMKVGEYGPEYMFSDPRVAILNNKTSKAFEFGYRMALGTGGSITNALRGAGLFGGFRRDGGDLNPAKIYRGLEDGLAEIFTSRDGQHFLMAPNGGTVTPMATAAAGPVDNRSFNNSQVNIYLTGPVTDRDLQRVEKTVASASGQSQRSFHHRKIKAGK